MEIIHSGWLWQLNAVMDEECLVESRYIMSIFWLYLHRQPVQHAVCPFQNTMSISKRAFPRMDARPGASAWRWPLLALHRLGWLSLCRRSSALPSLPEPKPARHRTEHTCSLDSWVPGETQIPGLTVPFPLLSGTPVTCYHKAKPSQ